MAWRDGSAWKHASAMSWPRQRRVGLPPWGVGDDVEHPSVPLSRACRGRRSALSGTRVTPGVAGPTVLIWAIWSAFLLGTVRSPSRRRGSRRTSCGVSLVGSELRAARAGRGDRLVDVAGRAGASTQYLFEVERGRKDTSSEVLAAVVGALDLTVRELAAPTCWLTSRRSDCTSSSRPMRTSRSRRPGGSTSG